MKILIEVLIVFVIGYGIWNEDKLIKFEDRLAEKIRSVLNG